MVRRDVGLAIFDMREAGVGDGVAVAEPVLVRELVDYLIEIPALAKGVCGLSGYEVQLARLWG